MAEAGTPRRASAAPLQGGEADAGDVDGTVVLGFGAAMLLVDAMMAGAILFPAGGTDAGAGIGVAWCRVSPRTELNLFSGLSHVVADAMRSLTQVFVGAAILAGGPSAAVDAYGTLVISAIIVLGATALLYEVAMQGREWWRSGQT